ncbi:sulfotransferase family protein [Geminocystis herdmanii]|uniref:sulfotransferase family protein n=1 Tax=Geminocystis herdmanii TaxID=669359 RepID=UPI00037F5DC8|nr:sulfotransferase [Geminocystis herdmanii]
MNNLTKFISTFKSEGKLPNFIIIGAMKSGTTSLHYYLNSHPEIFMSKEKELNFFIKSNELPLGTWEKGIDWYKSQFMGNAKIYGEASPNYTLYPTIKGIPQRMHSIIPNAKLIYIVRDPIERIISHYVHRYADGKENRTLTEALTDFDNNFYICRSQYYLQIEQYLQYYSPKNILVISTEELSKVPKKTLQTIFNFLGVSNYSEIIKHKKKLHKSIYKRRKNKLGNKISTLPIFSKIDHLPQPWRYHLKKFIYFPFSTPVSKPILDQELRLRLIEYLKEDVNYLREYTQKDFKKWCL